MAKYTGEDLRLKYHSLFTISPEQEELERKCRENTAMRINQIYDQGSTLIKGWKEQERRGGPHARCDVETLNFFLKSNSANADGCLHSVHYERVLRDLVKDFK